MMVGGKKIGDNAGLIGGEPGRQARVGSPGRNRRDVGCRAGGGPNGWKNREGPKNGGKASFVVFNRNQSVPHRKPVRAIFADKERRAVLDIREAE